MQRNRLYNFWLSLIVIGLCLLTASSALAHKVNVFAYAEGDMVYTESYFPDGRKVEGGKIEVYDGEGNKLLEGTADKQGIFNFKIPKVADLKIVLIATMGHKNSFVISADELAEASGGVIAATEQTEQAPAEQAEAKVAQPAPAPKSRPSRRAPEKEPFPTAGVLGGLGFIFGLTALILQLTGKKKG